MHYAAELANADRGQRPTRKRQNHPRPPDRRSNRLPRNHPRRDQTGPRQATPGYPPTGDDPLNRTALAAFFDVLTVLLKAGTTTVAEAAFQDRLWWPNLEPLTGLADIRIIRCTVHAPTAHTRIVDRATTDTHRSAHADNGLLEAITAGKSPIETFVPITIGLPTLTVDTTNGYRPSLADIITFASTTTP